MEILDTIEEKKAFILLNAIIFHYHGLDEKEEAILRKTSANNKADDELEWALKFISQDYLTAFERARDYLNEIVVKLDKTKRLYFIRTAWDANFEKGYITEMEATAMLQLARDWEVDADLIQIVQEA